MRLEENVRRECVSDLPLREAIIIRPDTPVTAAIELMREKQLGCAIVVDSEEKALGTFTERTVIDLLLQQPSSLNELVVGDHLDAEWFAVKQSDPISTVLEMIQERSVRFVCVFDDDGKPVALTGQKGLSEYVAEHFPRQVMAQRVGGRPGMETREGA
jgi:CBS domain-containing protein